MRIHVLLVACASVLGFAGVAHAAQIASPAIFGSHDQDQATCVVLNAGTESVSVTVRILNESGGTEAISSGLLVPGQFLVVNRAISFGVAYACTATAGSVGKLRGALTIRDTVPDGFGGSHRRPIRSSPLR